MRKKVLFLTALLLLVLVVPAYAVQPRSVTASPTISFDGASGTFTVTIDCDSSADEIEVDVEVWEDGVLDTIWSDEGTGSLTTSRTITVYRGRSYTLKVYATVNYQEISVAPVSKRCPWYA